MRLRGGSENNSGVRPLPDYEHYCLPRHRCRRGTHLHLELVEGELIDNTGKSGRNVTPLTLLREWLVQVFGIGRVNPDAPTDVTPEDNNPTHEPNRS
jgi:hypothetical protein